MTTHIFSGRQLRAENSLLLDSLTTITESAKCMLHFSSCLKSRTQIAILPKPEDGNHQLGHRIVKVEDNLGTQDFWRQCTKHEHVRHVVNMHKVIPPFPSAACKDRTGEQNERPVSDQVRDKSSALMF